MSASVGGSRGWMHVSRDHLRSVAGIAPLRRLSHQLRPQAGHRQREDAGDRRGHQGGRQRLPQAAVQDHRHHRPARGRRHPAHLRPERQPRAGRQDRGRVHPRRLLLRFRRVRRHVDLRPGEHPHRCGFHERHQRRAPGLALRGNHLGPHHRHHVAPRHRGPLPPVRGQPGEDALPPGRLRLRGEFRGALRPARRRHLHQGGGCRRGPGGQDRGGHPGGRPAQSSGDCGPRGRQCGGLRRTRRRPVRIDGSGKHRCHDSRSRHHARDRQRGVGALPPGDARHRPRGDDCRHPRGEDEA